MEKYKKELEQMYVRTEHWIQDYAFFEYEFKFLINLMDKYFVGAVIADEEKNEQLKDVVGRLVRLDEGREHLQISIKENLSYLTRLIQNKEVFDPEECRDRQSDLESDQTDFLRRYRVIKKEVFQLSEHLIQSARSRRLIG